MTNHFPKNFICATREFANFDRQVNAPYFRKKFHFKKGENARVRICGLGFYELYLNGKNVTKGRLAPYVTNPDQSLYYDDYDLTDMMLDGENVFGIWLGNGMQNNYGGAVWDFEKAEFRSSPKFAMALYSGDKILFESDESFLTVPSPITADDFRLGERYDARLEIADWNTVTADESKWKKALVATVPKGEPKVVVAEPVRVMQEIKPISVKKSPKGEYIYDFGTNFSGVCRLKIKGERGQEIRLTYGEAVVDGELDLRNITIGSIGLRDGYDHSDYYTLKGDGEEVFSPRFNYHGFQFVSVKGITDKQATLELLTFEVMHQDVKTNGYFNCSDQVANAIQDCVRRSDLSNLFYVPTDCPHREKNGWTGDVALSCEQMILNFNVKNTFSDWLFSVRNAQDKRGAIPGIIPTAGWGFEWGAGPNWDDALFELPYQLYRYTGDKKIIENNISAMEKYLYYMQTKRKQNGLFEYGLADWAEIEANWNFTTPTELTDSIKCIDICKKASDMAKVVGREDLAKFALDIANQTEIAFKNAYVKEGKLVEESQTALSFVLYYGIDKENCENFKKQLLNTIHKNGDFLRVGVLGARVIFRVLSQMGQGDLAFKMITRPEFPSYGYYVLRGAKTLPEQFYRLKDGEWVRDNGAKNDSMNHHFFGDVSAWFIAHVAGIKVNPNFFDCDYVEISPEFIQRLSFAESKYNHRKGEIFSRWERDGDCVKLTVKIPDGVSAKLVLPNGWVCEETTLGKSGVLKISKI